MTYRIQWHAKAERDLKNLGSKEAARIVKKIAQTLNDQPEKKGNALKGNLKGLYRLRVGDYRAIYEIRPDTHAVIILKVAHRREVYH